MSTSASAPASSDHAERAAPRLENYIGGRWVASRGSDSLEVHNPASGAVLAHVPLGGRDDVEAAVTAARAALPGWRAVPVTRRARILFGLRQALSIAPTISPARSRARWARRSAMPARRSIG